MLFICVHNAGRSQMAAALADHLSAGRVHVRSAGSAPSRRDQPERRSRSWPSAASTSTEAYPKPLSDKSSTPPTSS